MSTCANACLRACVFPEREWNGRSFSPASLIPHTQITPQDVVADVGKYKLFLPYCKDSVVLRRTPPHFMVVRHQEMCSSYTALGMAVGSLTY